MELKDTVCLVTGASSGIGRATAEALAARGARVAVSARRAPLLDTVEGAASMHPADLADPAIAAGLADAVLREHGRVDVLVNAAAVRVDGRISDLSLEDVDRSFQVNVLSPFALSGALAPGMVERGGGVIADLAAPAVSIGRRGMGAYAASKAALGALTQTLRQEVGGGRGVAVFGFDPGWVRTELAPDGKELPGPVAERLVAHIAAGRSSREPLR